MANIPIIGQPAKVLMFYPTTLVQCMCRNPQATLIIVHGIGMATLCPHCRTLYAATGFTTDPLTGQVSIAVTVTQT